MSPRSAVVAVLLSILTIALAACTVTQTVPPKKVYVEPPPPPPPPDHEFYELGEYGEWIEVYPHGLVWRPYVAADWRPYIYGHWVWSEWEWTWVSYEPFGWAVYHYGFWKYSPVWGWVWLPGYEWEPVRVKWAWYGDYVCWAPAPPPGYDLPDPWVTHTTEVWVVVHARHFTHYDLHRFRVTPARYKDQYRGSVKVHHDPPPLAAIERHTRKPVSRVNLEVKTHDSGRRTYKRIVLPETERSVVKKYKPHVQKRVMDTGKTKPKAAGEQRQRSLGDDEKPAKQKERSTEKKKESTRSKKKAKPKSKDKG